MFRFDHLHWLCLFLVVCASSCSGEASPLPEGIWEGTNVTMEYTNGEITSFRLEKMSCAAVTNNPDCDDVYPVTIEDAQAFVDGGDFVISRDYLDVAGSMKASGASGTYHFTHAEGCCELDGTWEASPPDLLDCSGGKDLASEGAFLELGLTDPSDGSFTKFQDGDDLQVVRGFQGALMAVPTLRFKGLPQEQSEVEISIVNVSAEQTVGYIRAVEPFKRQGESNSTLYPDLFVLVACTVVCPIEESQENLFLDQEVEITPRFKNACGLDFVGDTAKVLMRKAYD